MIRSGEVFTFGTNGAGKSTTVEILEGFRQRTGGAVGVGQDPARPSREWRERLGIMLQTTSEQLALTPANRIAHGPTLQARLRRRRALRRGWAQPKADADHHSPAACAGLDVGCAVVGRPELVFLDEPTTGSTPRTTAPRLVG